MQLKLVNCVLKFFDAIFLEKYHFPQD